MNNEIIKNITRVLVLIALQLLVFMNMLTDWQYINILIYPLIIILAPFKFSKNILLLIAFFTGLVIDFFYDTPGVHSGALVFTAFLRPLVISLLEPTGGYFVNKSPAIRNYGFNWFIQYSAIMMMIHLIAFYSLESFSFVYFIEIIKKTISSFFVSMIFVIVYQFIFNPKE